MQIRESDRRRFWDKVHIGESCWEWQHGLDAGGYGYFWIDGRNRTASRVVWEFCKGHIPKGLYVLHKCDNRLCVNPSHLFLGTPRDNMIDMHRKGRWHNDPSKGESHYAAKLTEQDVATIRAKYVPGIFGVRRLAKDFGVSPNAIWSIVVGKTWKG